jgi:hypothetical protein
MALQISYTDLDGDVHPNSYWVVSNVIVEKKLNDTPITPPSPGPNPDWSVLAGYYGTIVLMGWRTKADRDAGKNARFIHSVNPTGWNTLNTYHETVTSFDYRFTINPDDPLFDQAYVHLKTLDLFADSLDV